MKQLLEALRTAIKASLPYLSDVVVLDDENLPPEEIPFPFVGLRDEGIDEASKPSKHDLETLRVAVIVYQSILLNEPGAAVIGSSASLGAQGKGLLEIGAELRILLNDNYLDIPTISYAHCDRRDGTEARTIDGESFISIHRLHFSYKRYTT